MLGAFLGCQKVIRKTELAVYKLTYKPGEELVASYADTDKKHRCKNAATVLLEDATFSPTKVAAGEQILNRFVYACCAARGVPGTITRQVLHEGEVILTDETDFNFVPGTWAVTAYVQVPPNATPGAYVFELILKADKQVVKETHPFQVLKP
jgi:hypothetical protein